MNYDCGMTSTPAAFVALASLVAMCSKPSTDPSARPEAVGVGQDECKLQLVTAYEAEKAWYAAGKIYSEHPKQIGFNPAKGKYTFVFKAAGGLGVAPLVNGPIGLSGKCPACDITIVCVGNADDDPAEDVWSISTAQRSTRDGKTIPAGQPWNDVDDLASGAAAKK